MFCGDEGSESNFKILSGKNVDVLHLATHGFYYASPKYKNNESIEKLYKNVNLNFKNKGIEYINDDKMLTRSGLFMSGVNNILCDKSIPNGLNDGVLYADEVSHINLNHVNLLVLSACQSGLGDISYSEGVFGLQRGFKLAGVKSIIMSLWEVEDKATELLMTNLYSNLAEGQNLRDALMNAQLYLRTYNDGYYDNPKYWAAFILLDGLEH